jgi:hypothetical protein
VPGLRASKLLVFFFLIISVVACSTAAPGENRPLVAPAATPTALATEAPNLVTPRPQATPAANPTKKPLTPPAPTKKPASGSFYKPAGWDGTSDVDCPDFDTHAHAQSFFVGTGGSTTHDPYRLDADHDGNACESRP